ncbi:transporter substrate-binding domain-containing protein [Reinekea blandensis]|uniref:ABC-type amino acid transport/signal transduction systems, periplasmic component/domain n=1 Tax=Reinekea blandensis MED297 TaxID=314283 RepID=A4B9E0_9GAMM|nr:transporter substrate-binding domain-containing protein [Reinekea blandensis]EAR11241.1 ABC-type amino acid transport/signal transduction systems, periplasmic component/domain [Reinekea sp. MED297] [Reinekea blandensis MED297]
MKFRFIALVIALVGTATAGSWYFFKPSMPDLSNYQNITFGVDAPYPPYEFFDESGKLTGFEVELGNKACEYLGIQCQWQVTPWDTIMDDLNAREFDVIMSSMSINNERKKIVDFGEPYYSTPSVFFARKGEAIPGNSNRQLRGKTVAVQRGTLQHDYMLDNYDSNVTIMALDGWEDVSAAFRAAEADLVFTDYPQWEEEFFLERVYEIVGDAISLGDGVGLAFRKDDDDLRKALDIALNELKNNGEYQRIRRKYFFYDIMVE